MKPLTRKDYWIMVGLAVAGFLLGGFLTGCQPYRDIKQSTAEAMHPAYYKQYKTQKGAP